MHMFWAFVLYKVGVAIAVLVAIATQFGYSRRRPGFHAVDFFSYFTIESSIFGSLALAISAWAVLGGVHSLALEYLRGAAVLYMLVTGIVYIVLLAKDDRTLLPWVNAVLHYILPIVMLGDWLIAGPAQKLAVPPTLLWMAFPLAYLLYSLVRGHVTGWYPYPFLDVARQGIVKTALYCVAIAFGILGLGLAVRQLS